MVVTLCAFSLLSLEHGITDYPMVWMLCSGMPPTYITGVLYLNIRRRLLEIFLKTSKARSWTSIISLLSSSFSSSGNLLKSARVINLGPLSSKKRSNTSWTTPSAGGMYRWAREMQNNRYSEAETVGQTTKKTALYHQWILLYSTLSMKNNSTTKLTKQNIFSPSSLQIQYSHTRIPSWDTLHNTCTHTHITTLELALCHPEGDIMVHPSCYRA